MGRVILHCDMNSFYASCELTVHPELRGLPVAVGGDAERRHGIVLSSTQEARRFGVKTAMPIWQAVQLCPQLITLPAHFERYIDYSKKFREMCVQQSPLVESFGLDECWVDLTASGVTLDDGVDVANRLRERVKKELQLSISVGVSWNKVFAKLGSDMKKPDAVTLISPENYQNLVWPLPASDLLFIGPRTAPQLAKCNLFTIGDIANSPPGFMQAMFGKSGAMHLRHAKGQDTSPVASIAADSMVKSVGNSTTTPEDMKTTDEVHCVLTQLSESVAARLRRAGLEGKCISLSIRDTDLRIEGCQKTIDHATALSGDIIRTAMELFTQHGYEKALPLRSVGVSVGSLSLSCAPQQMDLFGEAAQREKKASLAKAIDQIRKRFGPMIIQRGNVLSNSAFSFIETEDGEDRAALFYAG